MLSQLTAFEQLGVAELHLEAIGVGQYFWPRAGFTLRRKADLDVTKALLSVWLYKHYRFSSYEEASAVAETAKSLHEIAVAPFGRAFLEWRARQNSWPPLEMILSMRDPTSIAYQGVLAYLRSRAEP
jgi:hypothetical protein